MKLKKNKWLAQYFWVPLSQFLMMILLCFLTVEAGLALVGDTTRVSVDSSGNQTTTPLSHTNTKPSISANGRFISFISTASDLVPGDTNGFNDIFVHDLQTGETTRVSVDSNGNQGAGLSPGVADRGHAISSDGRYVAFQSSADLGQVANAGAGYDIFVHDRLTGQTTLLDVHTGLVQNSSDPSISADGRYVAFASVKTDLVPGDTNSTSDIFVHDRQTGGTTRVSVDSSGNQAAFGLSSGLPSISADGRYVVFESYADNLVTGDTNNTLDIFVHDRQTGETTRVNVDSSGNQAVGGISTYSRISADGRYIAFQSHANNLVPGDSSGIDVFVHDLQTGETAMVSVDSASGSQTHGGQNPSFTANGRYVAFWSNISNLIPGEVNTGGHIYLHDRQTGQVSLATIAGSNTASHDTAISAGAHFLAFVSPLSTLVPDDTNNTNDVFVHQLREYASIAQDLDNDGDSDVVLRNVTDGTWRLFTMESMTPVDVSYVPLWANADWVYQTIADFDGDGDGDVVLRDSVNGTYRLFFVESGLVVSSTELSQVWRNLNWAFQGAGDFDGDGDADILIRNTLTGYYRAFFIEAGVVVSNPELSTVWRSLNWQFAGSGDLDQDGDADLLLRNSSTGQWRAFFMEAGAVAGSDWFSAWEDLNWSLQGLADYDNDGDADLLLRDVNGFWQIFEVEAGQVQSTDVVYIWSNPLWGLQSAELDLDGDTDADILLRHSSTGAWRTFTMENSVVIDNAEPILWRNQNWQFQKQ